MHSFKATFSLFLSTLSISFIKALATNSDWQCPPNGPLLPRPTQLADSKSFSEALNSLSSSIDAALKGDIVAGFSSENTSLSIAFVSFDDEEVHSPLWEYHHRGTDNVNGTEVVDGDTQYLVGSISKMITDLILLKVGMDIDGPVTEYLPQLKGASVIEWEKITLAALADHTAGIPPNFGYGETYYLAQVLQSVGYPQIPDSSYAECGVQGLNEACTMEQIFEALKKLTPIAPPFSHPVYSSLGFNILGAAMAAHTNQTYTQLLQTHILEPFALTNTGPSPGNDSQAALPPIPNSWGAGYGTSGFDIPGGGLYSSTNDLTTLAHAILRETALSTPEAVRKWMKPTSATSSPTTLVGRPWEIYRSQNLTPEYPHTIDIYSKNGGAYGYISQFSLVPQYGVGVVVLTAGDRDACAILTDAVLGSLLPAVEVATREQAAALAGTFETAADSSTNSTNNNVVLGLKLDAGPGLLLETLNSSDQSVSSFLSALFPLVIPPFVPPQPPYRVFPTGVSAEGKWNSQDVLREEWRIHLPIPPASQVTKSELPGQGAMGGFCTGWQSQDWIRYGQQGVDRMVLWRARGGGEVLGWEVPSLRTGLLRKA